MTTLIVSNAYRVVLPGVGKTRGLLNLSTKRLTKAVREALRSRYGSGNVEVTCEATVCANQWQGRCKIYEERLDYNVF